jgi:hypothetical protein
VTCRAGRPWLETRAPAQAGRPSLEGASILGRVLRRGYGAVKARVIVGWQLPSPSVMLTVHS